MILHWRDKDDPSFVGGLELTFDLVYFLTHPFMRQVRIVSETPFPRT